MWKGKGEVAAGDGVMDKVMWMGPELGVEFVESAVRLASGCRQS